MIDIIMYLGFPLGMILGLFLIAHIETWRDHRREKRERAEYERTHHPCLVCKSIIHDDEACMYCYAAVFKARTGLDYRLGIQESVTPEYHKALQTVKAGRWACHPETGELYWRDWK